MSAGARAILSIAWGPLASRRAVLEPGAELEVGRTEPAGLLVAHDRQMSGVHFALSWDGARGLVRDLGGAGGTWVDGARASEASVAHGGWIRAGDTIFLVHVEGAAARPFPVDPPDIAAKKQRALEALRAEPSPLFALLDAARDRRVLELLRGSVENYQSLYEGLGGQLLDDVAPYLVALPRGSTLLEALVREGWGRSFGAYLTSRRPFKEVRRHFRRLLMVDVEAGGQEPSRMYFRFYDPRVLRAFLPMCTVRQREEAFGEVDCFSTEGEQGELLRFTAG